MLAPMCEPHMYARYQHNSSSHACSRNTCGHGLLRVSDALLTVKNMSST